MELERARILEILLSVSVVGLFVALMLGIGSRYNTGSMSEAGGMALVAAIVVFLLVMAGMGVVLAYRLNEE